MSDETDNRCEYLPGTIGAELHCAHWHAADDAEFAGDRASAECCWCGDHEDGSGTCPGPTQGDTDHLLRRLRVARATVPQDGPTDRILAQAHDEIERLRHGPLRDDEPTRCTAGEVRQIMDEAEALEAENERLREAIATHRRDTETVDQYGTADYDYDNVNADLWASLSEAGGEGA